MFGHEDEDFDHGPAEEDEDGREDGAPGPTDTEARVTCPWCGEAVEISLDPTGGGEQEYVEDCEVCCRPWQVHVTYDEDGAAEVWVEESR